MQIYSETLSKTMEVVEIREGTATPAGYWPMHMLTWFLRDPTSTNPEATHKFHTLITGDSVEEIVMPPATPEEEPEA